jgi:xylulokinase
MRPYPASFLGIDIGTSGAKAIAINDVGRVLASAYAAYPLQTPRPGWMEQDPDEWWSALTGAVREVIERLPGGARSVAVLGLSGHMSSLVALGRDGRPLRPCITVADARGAEEASWLTAEFGARIESLTGGLPGTSDVAPKMLWLKTHEPTVYKRTASFVAAKDYVRFRLSGHLATEPTDAGNTLLLDLLTRRWDLKLCADMGLDPSKLPELVETTDVVGGVSRSAASATGLRPGTPVVAGGADMATSALGTAAVSPGVVAVTIGSSAQVTTPVLGFLPDARGRVSFHPHPVPDLLYAMGSIFGGGISLRWLAGAFGEERDLARLGARYFERLSRQAARSVPGSDGAIFLPFLVGSGSPHFDPAVRASFTGLSLATGRPQLVRAVLEGVAYNIRECVDVLRELGLPVLRVHLAGGGAASPAWRTIVSAVLGTPVRATRVRDASPLGAAALGAVGVGALADVVSAARTLVSTEEPVDPDTRAVEVYERGYGMYVSERLRLGHVSEAKAVKRDPEESGPDQSESASRPKGD